MPPEAVPSSLTLDISRTGATALVRCSGKLVSPVTGFFYTEVKPLTLETKQVVLDLTDLTHMDSMGIGVIVRLYVSAKSTAAICASLISANAFGNCSASRIFYRYLQSSAKKGLSFPSTSPFDMGTLH